LQPHNKKSSMEEFKKLWEENPNELNVKKYDKIRKKMHKMVCHKNNSNFDEAVCDICLDGYEDELPNGESDSLLIWDVCFVVVHQGCYMRDIAEKVPEGDWVWQKCLNIIYNSRLPKCKYCSDPQGAIVKCFLPEGQGKSKKRSQIWAHIGCVNWIAGIWFEDETLVTQSETQTAGLKCKIWKQKDWVWLQCDFKNWWESFHVRWAIKAEIIRADMDDQVDPKDEDRRFIFWKKHQAEGIKILKTEGSNGLDPDPETADEEEDDVIKRKQLEKLDQKLKDLKSKAKARPKPSKPTFKPILSDLAFSDMRQSLNQSKSTFLKNSDNQQEFISSWNNTKPNSSILNQSFSSTPDKFGFINYLSLPLTDQNILVTKLGGKINFTKNESQLIGWHFKKCPPNEIMEDEYNLY